MLPTWNIPRIFVHVYQVLAYTLYICLFDITLSLDNASFVIIFFCFSFLMYKNNDIIRQYLCIYIQIDASSSILHQKKKMCDYDYKFYIHCMIYIETKICTVSHVSGYGWIRKACSFYAINAGKTNLSYICLKLRKFINNLYTMIISSLF